jgi:hypothetical protein
MHNDTAFVKTTWFCCSVGIFDGRNPAMRRLRRRSAYPTKISDAEHLRCSYSKHSPAVRCVVAMAFLVGHCIDSRHEYWLQSDFGVLDDLSVCVIALLFAQCREERQHTAMSILQANIMQYQQIT